MPLLPGKKNIGHNIKEMEAYGHPHAQAIAAALNTARKVKAAGGGGVDFSKLTPVEGKPDFYHNPLPHDVDAWTSLHTGKTQRENQELMSRTRAAHAEAKETDIPISSLTGIESKIGKRALVSPSSELPFVEHSGGKYYVVDGNHRVISQHLKGVKSIRAKLADLDAVDRPARASGGSAGSSRSLIPAVRFGSKVYRSSVGGDDGHPNHDSAMWNARQNGVSMRDVPEDGSHLGYVNHKGHFLDRGRAMEYAREHDLLDEHARKYDKAQEPRDLPSEWLYPRRSRGEYADGGDVSIGDDVVHTGPIHSVVAGRTDHLPMHVPSGSYVIPADIISAMGEGNTMAGYAHMKRMFAAAPKTAQDPGNKVPIVAAGGEYVLSPDEVRHAGGGDLDAGHAALDDFVKRYRAKTIKTLSKLPGPVRD